MEPVLFIWFAFAFVLGAAVGSGLNVCIVRLPYEKSILWPNSHCGKCFQPVCWYDNLPLVSYWVLRGRCRTCKTPFSMRYFLIELFTGIVFAVLFYLDIVANVLDVRAIYRERGNIAFGVIPIEAWIFWGAHTVLVSLLIVTTCTDLEHMEIPLPVTVTGTLIGLVLSVCFPWPWPSTMQDVAAAQRAGIWPAAGLQVWPLWRPDQLPAWLAPGTWQLGLANSLAGITASLLVLRGIRFLFGLGRGIEGMGLGDADLMMMAGAFLGWQPIVIAFFVSVFPALLLGLGYMIFRGSQALPFGPPLALGILLALFGWRWISTPFQSVFFDKLMLGVMVGAGIVFMLIGSFVCRLLFGRRPAEESVPPANGGGEIKP
jgi:leader peptidase (prepilin peptidase)/N-methyltransferase